MASQIKAIQPLEGPFTHRVYIGFAKADKAAVFKLRIELENREVSCFLRPTDGVIQSSIQQGVAESQKCLLFMTTEYLKDDWFRMETEAVLDKAKRFSRDMVIILKTSAEQDVPEQFRGFNEFVAVTLNDKEFLERLVADIVREPNVMLAVLPKQNIGYGAAFSYFYGYLRLVLPNFKKRLFDETLKNDAELVKKTITKMLIIMPESCFCPPQIVSDGKIEFTEKYVIRSAHRAGNEKRDYKSSLFKLIGRGKEEYYFVGELATPLLTMYETYSFHLSGMTKDQLYTERDAFSFTLKAILSHPDNISCKDQFKLLYWSDPKTRKGNQLELYDFLLSVLQEEFKLSSETTSGEKENLEADGCDDAEGLSSKINQLQLDAVEYNPSRDNETLRTGASDNATVSTVNQNNDSETFKIVESGGHNPARLYDQLPLYRMNRRPRGRCLIVNIRDFNKGLHHLTTRRGSEKDTEILTKLFELLHFKVEVHNDLDAETLESLFLTTSCVDHKDYDAFACCILSHGKLGVIYTSDGKPIEILSLVNFFTDTNCPSLKGKPKMFFIQACQKGETESEIGANQSRTNPEGIQEPLAQISGGNLHTFIATDAIQDFESPSIVLEEVTVERALEEDAQKGSTLEISNFHHKSVLVPGHPDILMSYSTLPGSISFRDTMYGSLYIQALGECLGKGDQDIERELKQVSSRVKENLTKRDEADKQARRAEVERNRGEEEENTERFQLPFHLTSGMDKLIYL